MTHDLTWVVKRSLAALIVELANPHTKKELHFIRDAVSDIESGSKALSPPNQECIDACQDVLKVIDMRMGKDRGAETPESCDRCPKKCPSLENNPGWVYVTGVGLLCPTCTKTFLTPPTERPN